jgi:hypothetical protein
VTNADGTLTYTPASGFLRHGDFTYTACDDEGACDSERVTITVLPGVNGPPIATDDVTSTRTNNPVTRARSATTSTTTTRWSSTPSPDSRSTAAPRQDDGTVTYTPEQGFVGTDTFEISVSDGQGGFDTSVVTVVVAPDDNRPPVAIDDE